MLSGEIGHGIEEGIGMNDKLKEVVDLVAFNLLDTDCSVGVYYEDEYYQYSNVPKSVKFYLTDENNIIATQYCDDLGKDDYEVLELDYSSVSYGTNKVQRVLTRYLSGLISDKCTITKVVRFETKEIWSGK